MKTKNLALTMLAGFVCLIFTSASIAQTDDYIKVQKDVFDPYMSYDKGGTPGLWTGAVSSDWHNPLNWSDGVVPASTVEVVIPAPPSNQPVINSAHANCKSLTIHPFASLTIGEYYLTIQNDLVVHGALNKNSASGLLRVYGNVVWESGSTAGFTENSSFRVYGDWNFNEGANVNFANGAVDFMGTSTSWIRCYSSNCSFNNLRIYKSLAAVRFSNLSTSGLVIHSVTFIDTHAALESYAGENILMGGDFLYYGSFDFTMSNNDGSVIFNGISQTIDNYGTGSGTFGHVVFSSSTGTYVADGDFNVARNLTIEQGYFNAGSVTITVGGNWTNNAGDSGFIPSSSSIIFESSGDHQDVTGTNTFNNVTQLNAGKYLRFVGPTTIQNNLALNYLCWAYQIMNINGMLDLSNVGSRFTASGGNANVSIALLDQGGRLITNGAASIYVTNLVQNYLGGMIEASSGSLIDITNSGAEPWVDLKGSIYNSGGTINLSGSFCYWPYVNGAHLEMTDGIIDIKTCDLTIYNSFTWTHNITGGTIRTSKGFAGYRADFTPTAGTFEFYSSSDCFIRQYNGCTLHDVVINKSAKKGDENTTVGPVYDDRSGELLSEGIKANTITLATNFTATGDLTIEAGSFNLDAFACDVFGTTRVFGNLIMNDPANDLTTVNMFWDNGSTANVTAGTFHATWWYFREGTQAKIGTGNTAYVQNMYYVKSNEAEFGNLVRGPLAKNLPSDGYAKAYYPLKVMGYYLLFGQNIGYYQPGTGLIVAGNATIESDAGITFNEGDFVVGGTLTLNGRITLNNGHSATVGGEFFPNTGSWLEINNGTFTNNYDAASGFTNLSGKLTMNENSIVEFPGRSISINSTFVNEITGGTLRFGRAFKAISTGTFQQNSGTIEFVSSNVGHYIQLINGNFANDLVVNKPSGYILVHDNLTIVGDLTIDGGSLNSNNKTIQLAGNWNNNAGSVAFSEGTGLVVFNGDGADNHQLINGTTNFYDVSNAKTGGGTLYFMGATNIANNFIANGTNVVAGPALSVEGLLDLSIGSLTLSSAAPAVTVNNFTMDGSFSVIDGNFTCTDITNDGIYGTIHLYNGQITLNQVGNDYTDLNGDLTIEGGNMNVNGVYGYCEWGWAAPASFTMTGGTLSFNNPGISILSPRNVTTSISGGTIRTSGSFWVTHPNFTPTGGTAELYGNNPVVVQSSSGAHFYNLTIDKPAGSLLGGDLNKEEEQIAAIQEQRSQKNRTICEPPSGRSGNIAYTNGNLKVVNNTVIEEGSLIIEHDASISGDLTVNEDGRLSLLNLGSLAMGDSKMLTLNSGGELSLQGNAIDFPKITSISGNYGLNIESGANIGAEYAIFEYMNTAGVNVKPGAHVDPAKSFTNCIFRNGQSGGRLLTLNNNQTLLLSNVNFPGSSGNFNVSKTKDAGVVVLTDYSGGFAGASWEQDDHNRIHWTGEPSTDIILDGVVVGSYEDFCFEAIENITVGGSQNFVVEAFGEVNLVAGESILMLPGTHALSGSYLHAQISDVSFCSGLPLALVAAITEDSDQHHWQEMNEVKTNEGFIKVFPNPARDIITLELIPPADDGHIVIEVYNLMGQNLMNKKMEAELQYQLDLTGLQSGVYLLKLMHGSTPVFTKLIKQ